MQNQNDSNYYQYQNNPNYYQSPYQQQPDFQGFTSFNEPVYAGFWRRWFALVLDSLIIAGPILALEAMTGKVLVPQYMMTIIWLVYYMFMDSSKYQGSLGKIIMGIKITSLDGERISPLRALGRHVAAWLSTLIILVGYLMQPFTGKRQTLHDIIAKTLVVKR